MTQRLHAGQSPAFFSWRDRRSTPARVRQNRPCLEHLESRRLLATVAEFPVPSGTGAAPVGITAGPGGSIWFTENGADKIGTIDPSTHAISEYPIPTTNAQPHGIALGPDGNLWFTEIGVNQIGMINPTTHDFTEFAGLTAGAVPFDIAAGPNNTIWFTEKAANQIGMIDVASGKVTEYAIPTSNSVPEGITLGSDGNMWFAESLGNQIAMFDTTNHTFAEHLLPTAGAQPYGITTSPGGDLWFTEYTGNQIGVYSLSSSSFSQFSIPTSNTQPTEIAAAADGIVWFTQSRTNQVAMLNPMLMNPTNQNITEFATPSAISGPRGIVVTGGGTVWFTEVDTGRVATIAPSTHIVVTSSPPLDMRLGDTFGLTVAVEYDSGDVDAGYDGSVTVAISGGPAVGSLAGTTTVTAKDGIASFTGLSLTDPGSYSLQVTSGVASPADIGPINVTGPTGTSPGNPRGEAPLPPVVLSEQLVLAGKGKNRYVAAIVITFSSALDSATAQNASNYTVTQLTKNGRAKAAKALRLRAIYNPAGNTVRLTLAGKPRFAAGGQLVVIASRATGIAGPSGMHLEGNTGAYSGADGLYTILPNGRGMAN